MILVIGDASDPVLRRARLNLERQKAPLVCIDESAGDLRIERIAEREGPARWRIAGTSCPGTRHVGAVLIRRGPVGRGGRPFSARVDQMLSRTSCAVVNRPSRSTANYSKPFQLRQLGRAGFVVPTTLVTGLEIPAMRFLLEHRDAVLKGVSSWKTIAHTVSRDHLGRLPQVARCPTQFQQRIEGVDWRVTVVGETAFASEVRPDGSSRTSVAHRALPRSLASRCVEFTRSQGLVVGGIDLRIGTDGIPALLELNPYPLLTYYEREEDPMITLELCRFLRSRERGESDILV